MFFSNLTIDNWQLDSYKIAVEGRFLNKMQYELTRYVSFPNSVEQGVKSGKMIECKQNCITRQAKQFENDHLVTRQIKK